MNLTGQCNNLESQYDYTAYKNRAACCKGVFFYVGRAYNNLKCLLIEYNVKKQMQI